MNSRISVASISVRENERGAHVGAGWDPQWHQPKDLYATYDDKEIRLGLNAAETTLSAVARLAGAGVKISGRPRVKIGFEQRQQSGTVQCRSIWPQRPAPRKIVRLFISACAAAAGMLGLRHPV